MDIIKIGKVFSTKGLKGELKIFLYLLDPSFLRGKKVIVEKDGYERAVFKIEYVSDFAKGRATLKFEEIKNIVEADLLKGKEIYIKREILQKEHQEYLNNINLINMSVYSDERGYIGRIERIFNNSAYNVYVVNREGEEIFIPSLNEFVKKIDFDENMMVVKLVEGMLKNES